MSANQSQTQTQVESSAHTVLHLRPVAETFEANTDRTAGRDSRQRVRWTNDVVDNEHMNKKKSKICCIFHPQREFGESSGESSSDSSDSDSSDASEGEECGDIHRNAQEDFEDVAAPPHEECCGHHHHKSKKSRKSRTKPTKRPSSPNAYERQPQYKNKSVLPQETI